MRQNCRYKKLFMFYKIEMHALERPLHYPVFVRSCNKISKTFSLHSKRWRKMEATWRSRCSTMRLIIPQHICNVDSEILGLIKIYQLINAVSTMVSAGNVLLALTMKTLNHFIMIPCLSKSRVTNFQIRPGSNVELYMGRI